MVRAEAPDICIDLTDPGSDDTIPPLGQLRPIVLAYLRRTLGSSDAEDVAQQVLVECWRHRARYDPSLPWEGWVLGIARKRAIDWMRRSARVGAHQRPTEPVDPEVRCFTDGVVSAQSVRQALALLPDGQREVLVLTYFGGLTQPQIADRLQVPLGTVKARAHRGLRALALLLVPEGDE